MPEREIRLFSGTNPVYVGHLNPDDKLKTSTDDDGNFLVEIEGAIPQGDVHEVSIGPGAAGGVAKVFPPLTEAHAVAKAEERGTGFDEKVPAKERQGASAAERKAVADAGGPLPDSESVNAGGGAPDTSGETPPESGGKAGTGFSGQVAP